MKKDTKSTVSIVTELVKPIAEKLSLDIWDIRFEKEGSMWMLKVIIDREGGVSIDDCEALSRPLDKKLDEVDPIEQSYCLEVSSAGIERSLTKDWHFKRFMGEKVTLRLIRPYEGERTVIGILSAYSGSTVTVDGGAKGSLCFPMTDVAYVRLYAEFE